jgi:hypothetical protein
MNPAWHFLPAAVCCACCVICVAFWMDDLHRWAWDRVTVLGGIGSAAGFAGFMISLFAALPALM